jgi:hypothetical protein
MVSVAILFQSGLCIQPVRMDLAISKQMSAEKCMQLMIESVQQHCVFSV